MERFTPSGLLQAQGGGYDNDLTQQQLHYYDPTVFYPISGTQISRKWEYDKAQHLIAQNDRTWGSTEYRHNRNGQIEHALGNFYDERCHYDSQQNLTFKAKTEPATPVEQLPQQWQIKQHHGRVVRQHNTTFHYDRLGRLTEKWEIRAGFRPQKTLYRWNSQNQLVEFSSPQTGRWRYEYDSFGRRLRKYQLDNRQYQAEPRISTLEWVKAKLNNEHIIQPNKPLQATRFVYYGNQLVAEIPQVLNQESPIQSWQDNWQQAIYWLYQSETDFSPIASYQQGELFYTVTDHIGTVTELVSERGHIEYQQHLSLWGEADFRLNRSLNAKTQEPLTCRLRFAGQYADEESGLYYNRHRYYNPAVGQYINPDPIGLLGGFNPYGYVGLPTEWVDPLGLKGCSYKEIEKQKLPDWIVDTFKDGKYKTVELQQDMTYYRVYGGKANENGSFVTTSPAINRIQAKIDSALLPEWKNTRQYEAIIVVPKGTIVNVGKVAPQVTRSGAVLSGGTDQILLPQNYDPSWIKSTRVVPQ